MSATNENTNTIRHNNRTGTGAAHGTKTRGTKYRQIKLRRIAGGKPLRRCDTALIPQPIHPQPPGAFNAQQSFVVPRYPKLDDRNLPPFAAQDIFIKAKQERDQVFLRAQEEREERSIEAEHADQLEQELEARLRADDAEYLRRIEEDSRRADAVHHRALQEELTRKQAERFHEVMEACRQADEERQRQAQPRGALSPWLPAQPEREAMERTRREQERIEQERREEKRLKQKRLERKRCEREAAQRNPETLLRLYEGNWAKLRSNSVGAGPLTLNDVPWPWFGNVPCLEDITDKRVLEFVGHPLRRHMQSGGGLARTLRFELLHWHSDRFDRKVLDRVVDDHREAVKNAAERVTRILTDVMR